MERLVKGDVVVAIFLLRSLDGEAASALVVAAPGGDDIILCQITSQQIRDRYAVGITDMNFAEGTLRKPSNIRPNRLFSASVDLILYRTGCLNDQTVTSVIDRIIGILQAE